MVLSYQQAAESDNSLLLLESNEKSGSNLTIEECQSRKNEHSDVEQPLILHSGSPTNEMKRAERFPNFNVQQTTIQQLNHKRQRGLHIIIAVLSVILVISLISMLMLLIERNGIRKNTSLTKDITNCKGADDSAACNVPISSSKSRLLKPSPQDLVNFIRNGLNTSISPCHDFYGHVCGSHNSSSHDLLQNQFYHLIMAAINNDTRHPEVSTLLLNYVEGCAKQNGSAVLKQTAKQQNLNGFGLIPFKNEAEGKNFNFMLPLLRILFHSPVVLNVKLLHSISYDDNTVALFADPSLLQISIEDEHDLIELAYDNYLSVVNFKKSELELITLKTFVMEFNLICVQSISNGTVSNIEIKSVQNAHFKEALEKLLPFLFRLDLNISALYGNFRVRVDLEMIDKLQQLFASHPSEGQLFLKVVALYASNFASPVRPMDSWESMKQICFFGVLSLRRYAIFNLYAANLVLRAHFPMTQVSDQLLVRNLIEKIRQTMKKKLLATAWLKTNRELVKSLNQLMETKKVVGLPETVYEMAKGNDEDAYEIDRFEVFLSLHKQREDKEMLVHLANSRLESDFQPHFESSATYDGETVEFSHMYLQRPYYAAQFPESYNYGFMGSTIGHELFHQFTPKRVTEFWLHNQRYNESVNCYSAFYDGICFNLTLSDKETNATKMQEECAEGLDDRNENIPDVEGARAAFATMRMELGEAALKERAMPEFTYTQCWALPWKPKLVPNTAYTNEQMFFVAVAQDYCDKDLNDHEYLAAHMHDDDDPHSSGNVRVNAIAMQMEEFADAFHCEPNDPMVTAEHEKCYLLPPS